MLENGYLDYNKLVLVSPSLQQLEYQVIIKSFEAGLSKQQTLNLFKYQKDVKDLNNALNNNKKLLPENHKPPIEILTFNNPNLLPNPENLISDRQKKVLVVIDDCTIIKSDIPSKYYLYARPLYINLMFLAQNYTKIPKFIRENTNLFIMFKINNRTLKEVVFMEIGECFNKE